jgi:hypothetical protein
MGATPHRLAKEASLFNLWGLSLSRALIISTSPSVPLGTPEAAPALGGSGRHQGVRPTSHFEGTAWAYVEAGSGRPQASPTAILQDTHSVEG